jgi:hypothetical protein
MSVENPFDELQESRDNSTRGREVTIAGYKMIEPPLDKDMILELWDLSLEQNQTREKLREMVRESFVQFVDLNSHLFKGIPRQVILNSAEVERGHWSLEPLSHLLALPFHLKKMREDGITDLVISASSSVPYGFMLKEIDRLMFPDEKPINFYIYSTKVDEDGEKFQNNKFINLFKHKKDAIIGVFDECASSNENSDYNKRTTVTKIQKGLETIISNPVRGRYGTDSVFPTLSVNGLQIHGSRNGDEGKGWGLYKFPTHDDAYDEHGRPLESDGNIYRTWPKYHSHEDGYKKEIKKTYKRGYYRVASGRAGLDKIERLRGLARAAFINYSSNPHSIWDPAINTCDSNGNYRFSP